MEEVRIDKKRKLSLFNIRDLTCIVVAVTIFLSIDPFIVWSSFAGGLGVTAFKGFQLLSIVLLLSQLKVNKMPVPAFISALSVMAIFFFYCFFTGVISGTTHPLMIGNVLVYFFYALNAITDREILVTSFGLLRKIFAVVLAYTLVIHLLILCRISLPYFVLQSGEAGRVEFGGQFYQNYFGCLLINQNGSLLYRFTSVFTEPGVVGTFCAFLLTANDFKFKESKADIVFLISGILSFSVAFFVLTAIAYALKTLRGGGYKRFTGIALIFVAYIIFINLTFSNPMLTLLQQRLSLTESGLAGDNRIKDVAENSYQLFLNSDIRTVLLGYGYPPTSEAAAWQATASYKESVYCVGVLGYALMIAFFVLAPIFCYKTTSKKNNRLMYAYILIFIISQYQRPYMKALFLVYILLAGCLYIRQSGQESK